MSKIIPTLVSVMAEVGAITKDKKNTHQGYSFRGIDDVYNAIQPALIKHGVIVMPSVKTVQREERTTKSGGALIYTTITCDFIFHCAEDGSSLTATTVGEAMDSGDKSANKAMSAAYKYAMFQALAIPTEEHIDSEVDSPEPAPREEKTTVTLCTDAQIDSIKALCQTHGVPPENIKSEFGTISKMPEIQVRILMPQIESYCAGYEK